MWITAIAVVVAAIIAWRVLATKKRLRELRSDAERLSAEIFGALPVTPTVEVGFSYGYPCFQVTFPSKELLASAEHAGLTRVFTERIQDRCKDTGPKKHPFDASRAIWFTSRESLEEIRKEYGSQSG